MIEFIDVVKSYPEGNHALRGVSMQIEDGEFCYLVGPSGSGKSTIIKMITGELSPRRALFTSTATLWSGSVSVRFLTCAVRLAWCFRTSV